MAYAGVDRHKRFCQTIVGRHTRAQSAHGRVDTTEKEDIVEFFSGLERLEIALAANTNYE